MKNLEKFRSEIATAVADYKADVFNSLECQLFHIRVNKVPCKKGLFGRGCRACTSDTLEWLFDEADTEESKPPKEEKKNCEVYADEIEEAVSSACEKGLRAACAMYMMRTHNVYEFTDSFYELLQRIDCDGDCKKCNSDTADWLSESAIEALE